MIMHTPSRPALGRRSVLVFKRIYGMNGHSCYVVNLVTKSDVTPCQCVTFSFLITVHTSVLTMFFFLFALNIDYTTATIVIVIWTTTDSCFIIWCTYSISCFHWFPAKSSFAWITLSDFWLLECEHYQK